MVDFGTGILFEGDQIGSYTVGVRLGEGATGTVYRATRDDGLEVALKILKSALAADDAYLARFRREARIAADVQHRNLIPVVESGVHDGVVYLASAYLEGGSLASLVESEGRLPLADCKRVAIEVANGLGALHSREIVHRDIKPANVILDRAGSAALTDFGLARGHAYTVLTRPGQVLGTLDYLAPELIEGKESTPASDIYALGCLVYECVTGATPFGERGVFEVAVAHLEEEPRDPRERRDTLSAEFAWAVLRALQKDPSDRPTTAVAYANLLAVSSPQAR